MEEAAIAGENAAKKILGKTEECVKKLEVKTGNGVRYTVPERLDLTAHPENLRIFFRVTDIIKKVHLIGKWNRLRYLRKSSARSLAPATAMSRFT